MENIVQQVDNFVQDMIANLSQVQSKESAIRALNAMIEDANLLKERLNELL